MLPYQHWSSNWRGSVRSYCLLMIGLICLSGAPAHAVPVSFLWDSAYVDTGREARHMRADLLAAGHTVKSYAGASDAAVARALSGASALVIPELERGNYAASLSRAAGAAIERFIRAGGGLVVSGSHTEHGLRLMNSLFGWNISTAGNRHSREIRGTAAAAASSPSSLSSQSAVWSFGGPLPGGARALYAGSGGTAVMTAQVGAGHVTFLGYDWFSGSDAGWRGMLDLALAQARPVPEPGAPGLLALGLLGLAALGRAGRWRSR